MQPQGLNVNSDAMHGEKVGVATIIISGVYHKLANSKVEFSDYLPYSKEFVHKMFGDELTRQIMRENEGDTAVGVTKEKLESCFDKIREIISEIPTQEKLIEIYDNLGVKKMLSDIDVPDDKLDLILEYAPCVRMRLTLLRLKKAIKIVG
jgi:glycerol-1-phosphate dehydrogenase [NAD(P)+]